MILINIHAIAVAKMFEDKNVVQLVTSTVENGDNTITVNPEISRKAKTKKNYPGSGANALLRTVWVRTVTFKSISAKPDEHRMRVARETVGTLPNWPLFGMVTNMSNVSVNLPKSMKVALLRQTPPGIVPVQEALHVNSVNATLIWKEGKIKSENLPSISNWRQTIKKMEKRLERSC